MKLYKFIFLLFTIVMSPAAYSRSSGYEMSKTTMLIPDAEKSLDENLAMIQRNEREKTQKNMMNDCNLVYEGQKVKIMKELNINSVKIKVKEGVCKGKIGYVEATSIRVRRK